MAMEIKKPTKLIVILVFSSILTIINGILIALNNGPLMLASYTAKNIADVWVTPYAQNPPWVRIVYGMPDLTENGLAYGWLSIAVLQAAFALYIFVKPKKIRSAGLWIIILSLLTIPIGGGFYIGLILSVIIGLYSLEYPKKLEETFIGKIINTLRFNAKFFEDTAANPNLQKATLTLFFIALLSGFGSSLYSYNVYKIYPAGDLSRFSEAAATEVLIRGRLYSDPIVYTSTISNVFIMLIKWLILTLSIYFFAFKIVGKEAELFTLSSLSAYIYVPELIFIFTPLIFTNEPNLSQTWSLIVIPVSWPLLLFYVSRIWSFSLLSYAISKLQDITFGKAIGRALFAAIPYLMLTYMWVYPTFKAPGFYITFTGESSSMLAFLAAIAYIIALLFGALKKE
jgi:hypothetical protein